MKLTKQQLKQIIKEELKSVLQEGWSVQHAIEYYTIDDPSMWRFVKNDIHSLMAGHDPHLEYLKAPGERYEGWQSRDFQALIDGVENYEEGDWNEEESDYEDDDFKIEDHDDDIIELANIFVTDKTYTMREFGEDILQVTKYKLSPEKIQEIFDWANERIGPLDPL